MRAAGSVLLRDADERDVPALAELHVRTFRETHGDGPDVAIRERQWQAKFRSAELVFCVVLEDSGEGLVGFASGELHDHPEPEGYAGELNKIYLLRTFQRLGLGRRLLCAASVRFVRAGVGSMLLFGDARSPSNGFYEAMGGTRLHAPTGEFHGGYGWPELSTLLSICANARLHGHPAA